MVLKIDIYSDVICPWCFIGKRRLEKALVLSGGRYDTRITWLPFQLNPGMAKEGMDRKAYRTAKFGSLEKSQALDLQVQAAGAIENIPFAFDRIDRTPNTLDAHRLIWIGREKDIQDAVVEALFKGYFLEAKDIGDREVLREIAHGSGLSFTDWETFLEDTNSLGAVKEEEEKARGFGISSVPTFIINGEYLVSGARDPETLASAFDQVMKG